jgi:hypothetical protein
LTNNKVNITTHKNLTNEGVSEMRDKSTRGLKISKPKEPNLRGHDWAPYISQKCLRIRD